MHSPEKLLQIIAEMNATIANEKTSQAVLERKSRDLHLKLEALTTIETELGRIMQQMEALAIDQAKRHEVEHQVEITRDAISQSEIRAKDLQVQAAQQSRQMHAAQEKQARLTAAQTERRERLAIRLQELQAEWNSISEERNLIIARIEQSERTCKEYEVKMAEMKRTHESELQLTRNDYVALKAKVLSYNADLRKAIKPA